MTCVVGKNRITCYRTPSGMKGRVMTKDGSKEFWTNLDKNMYDIIGPDSVIRVFDDDEAYTEHRYIKRFTKWAGTVVEYLQRLEIETDKKCEAAKAALNLTKENHEQSN